MNTETEFVVASNQFTTWEDEAGNQVIIETYTYWEWPNPDAMKVETIIWAKYPDGFMAEYESIQAAIASIIGDCP